VLLKNGASAAGSKAVLPLKAGVATAVLGPHFNASFVLIQPDTGDTCPSGGLDCVRTPVEMIRKYNSGGATLGAVGSYLLAQPPSPHAGMSAEELLNAALKQAKAAEQVVMVLGIRQNSYGCFDCGRACVAPPCPRCKLGTHCYAPAACRKATRGDMANFSDSRGIYGDVGKTSGYNRTFTAGDQHIEGETHDRTSIDLPAPQRALAAAVIALGKPTVIVLLNGGSVALEQEMKADNVAIAEAWYPGTRGSEAIATALFAAAPKGEGEGEGEAEYVDRWGRMPYSVFPAGWVDDNAMDEMDLAAAPGRTYRYAQPNHQPLVPFGAGLQLVKLSASFGTLNPSSIITGLAKPTALGYKILLKNSGKHSAEGVVTLTMVPK